MYTVSIYLTLFHQPSDYETERGVQPVSNLRKVDILLRAIDRTGKNIRYFALDLDHAELVRSLAKLPAYKNVSCSGLWGSYEDGFRWLNGLEKRENPATLLSLGSSIGNFPRANAVTFMSSVSRTLRPESGDAFLIAFDHCCDPCKVWKAYHDSNGMCSLSEIPSRVHPSCLRSQLCFSGS